MQYPTKNSKSIWLSIGVLLSAAILVIFVFSLNDPLINASAHANPVFGPACGMATIDGNVKSAEWSSASKKTFLMVSSSITTPFTATLYVMNSGNYLYLGITINDDEFSTYGQYLAQGDAFRIDFDNDHSGSLFAVGDDVLAINAGSPQFTDSYLYGGTSSQSDVIGGGTTDGNGAAARRNNLNHFELRHPLCSGDTLDFCLHSTSVIGFRLKYLDAQANGDFGGSQFYPGTGTTSIADIVIGTCSLPDLYTYLPLVRR